jgi:hypothetical protein
MYPDINVRENNKEQESLASRSEPPDDGPPFISLLASL